MEKSCEQIEKLLVDYADGELSSGESSKVAEHLAKCERCRKTFQALERSMELAGVIWEDGLREIEDLGVTKVAAVRRFKWGRYAAIAASILIAAGIFRAWHSTTSHEEPTLTFAEVEQRIEQSGRAARLLAAAELLAECPDAQSIVEKQYRYIVETYPQTPAAAKAKSRIQ